MDLPHSPTRIGTWARHLLAWIRDELRRGACGLDRRGRIGDELHRVARAPRVERRRRFDDQLHRGPSGLEQRRRIDDQLHCASTRVVDGWRIGDEFRGLSIRTRLDDRRRLGDELHGAPSGLECRRRLRNQFRCCPARLGRRRWIIRRHRHLRLPERAGCGASSGRGARRRMVSRRRRTCNSQTVSGSLASDGVCRKIAPWRSPTCPRKSPRGRQRRSKGASRLSTGTGSNPISRSADTPRPVAS